MQHVMQNEYLHLLRTLEHECFVKGCSVSMCHTIQLLSEYVTKLDSNRNESMNTEIEMLASHLSDFSVFLRMGSINCHEAYFLTTTKLDTFITQVLRPHIVSIYGSELDDMGTIFKGITIGKA